MTWSDNMRAWGEEFVTAFAAFGVPACIDGPGALRFELGRGAIHHGSPGIALSGYAVFKYSPDELRAIAQRYVADLVLSARRT